SQEGFAIPRGEARVRERDLERPAAFRVLAMIEELLEVPAPPLSFVAGQRRVARVATHGFVARRILLQDLLDVARLAVEEVRDPVRAALETDDQPFPVDAKRRGHNRYDRDVGKLMKKIATFDDWVDAFRSWQRDIGLRLPPSFANFQFEAKYGDLKTDEIEFGDFQGEKKWEKVTRIPHQPIRDALLNLIVYQGDTEFASVEQQRHLMETSPSDYDTESVSRIMVEEMRHGWQMCHLLVNHFGETGKIEARKLLERRSWQNTRLLGSFNVDVDNWVDFFTYTEFVDRDGKFQLNMLSTSSFAPLARSMGPMLKEEG